MKNVFIVLDGIDGTGKSTQLAKLHDYLFKKDKRIRILSTREPTYGKFGKKIRTMLKEHNDPYSSSEELLDLYVKDREEHVKHVIEPFLNAEDDNIHVILCDRYYYSTIAYQTAQGIDLQKALDMNKVFPRPDLGIILDLSPEIALERINQGRTTEKFEDLEFMGKIRKGFHALKDHLPDTLFFVDSSGTEEQTFSQIKALVDGILSAQ